LEEGAERIFLKKNFLRAGRGGRRGWKNYVKKTFSGAGSGCWVHSSQSLPDNRERFVGVSNNRQLY
jgi:hypothetical protein